MSKFSDTSPSGGFPSVSEFDNNETPYEARLRQYRDHMAYLKASYSPVPHIEVCTIEGNRIVVR